MEITRQRSKRGVIRQPLKELGDIGDPKRTLKPGSYLLQSLRKGQCVLLIYSAVAAASRRRTCSTVTPIIRTTLLRFVAPLAMVTDARGIWNKPAKNSMTA